MQLQNRRVDVVESQVPTGTYQYVAFTVDPSQSYVVIDGKQEPLGIPLQDVRVNGPFSVGPNLPTTVTITFDPESSLTENADGSFTLNFVVVLDIATG